VRLKRRAMGIYIDYVLRAECAEEEVRQRLERVRQRCLDLPLKAVGDVQRVTSIHNPVILHLFQEKGHTLPEAVAERLREVEGDRDHGLRSLCFGPPIGPGLPKDQLMQYVAPALAFIKETDRWKKEELPEKIEQTAGGFTVLTVYREGIELEFACVLLRYGYLLILHPGEGSETVNLALSTFGQQPGRRSRKPPLWYGQSFTKTQYAKEFIQVHETICRALDIVQEEGLLLEARDNCGYFASRSWKEASQRVNEELLFAQAVSGMMGVAIGNLREEGVEVQVLEDNASKAKPVDFSAALAREEEAVSEE
jgi:hypothetical protein